MISRLGASLLAACLILVPTMAAAQPAVQVADINTTTENVSDPLFTGEDFAVLGTDLFFLQDDGIRTALAGQGHVATLVTRIDRVHHEVHEHLL